MVAAHRTNALLCVASGGRYVLENEWRWPVDDLEKKTMKTLTNGLVGLGVVRLRCWNRKDHLRWWLETVDGRTHCCGTWRFFNSKSYRFLFLIPKLTIHHVLFHFSPLGRWCRLVATETVGGWYDVTDIQSKINWLNCWIYLFSVNFPESYKTNAESGNSVDLRGSLAGDKMQFAENNSSRKCLLWCWEWAHACELLKSINWQFSTPSARPV